MNRFRVETLGLDPVSTLWAPGQLYRLKVPYTYLWSPGLVPKPPDWGPEIDIAGFVFLDLAVSFNPSKSLSDFLAAGETPIYIGFGSIVVDDPDKFTSLIFQAVAKAGVRALVSKGWGGLGDEDNKPENIYMLDNTPHDWLFPLVSAVVHHGGAGTTAIGLKCGKPTMIVPFFGDQPFWGAMVAKAGAGASEPIPYKRLSVDAFAAGIQQCLSPQAKEAAEKLAQDIMAEGDGADNAIESFHRHLPIHKEHSMRCSMLQNRVAVWEVNDKSGVKLSALAAELLTQEKLIKRQDLRLVRHCEWNDFVGPGEPITGGATALLKSIGGVITGVGSVPMKWVKIIKKREKRDQLKDQRRDSDATQKEPSKETSLVTADLEAHSNSSETISTANEQKTMNTPLLAPVHGLIVGNGIHGSASSNDVIDGSRDNLAQDLAVSTGAGLAKTGEALAKGTYRRKCPCLHIHN